MRFRMKKLLKYNYLQRITLNLSWCCQSHRHNKTQKKEKIDWTNHATYPRKHFCRRLLSLLLYQKRLNCPKLELHMTKNPFGSTVQFRRPATNLSKSMRALSTGTYPRLLNKTDELQLYWSKAAQTGRHSTRIPNYAIATTGETIGFTTRYNELEI